MSNVGFDPCEQFVVLLDLGSKICRLCRRGVHHSVQHIFAMPVPIFRQPNKPAGKFPDSKRGDRVGSGIDVVLRYSNHLTLDTCRSEHRLEIDDGP